MTEKVMGCGKKVDAGVFLLTRKGVGHSAVYTGPIELVKPEIPLV